MVVPTFNAYANPPFAPSIRLISNITQANPAVVTTTQEHRYNTGIVVRLYVPQDFGMVQMNQLFAPISVLSPTMFSIAIDSSEFFAFSDPGTNLAQTAMAVPIGDANNTLIGAVTNLLPNAVPIQNAPIPVPPSFIGLPQD